MEIVFLYRGFSFRPDEELLVTRSIYKGMINPGEEKQTVASQSTGARLEYTIRVRCDEHYYGTKCNRVCRPRDDYFGHYVCDQLGNRECMEGWTNLTASCKTGRKKTPLGLTETRWKFAGGLCREFQECATPSALPLLAHTNPSSQTAEMTGILLEADKLFLSPPRCC